MREVDRLSVDPQNPILVVRTRRTDDQIMKGIDHRQVMIGIDLHPDMTGKDLHPETDMIEIVHNPEKIITEIDRRRIGIIKVDPTLIYPDRKIIDLRREMDIPATKDIIEIEITRIEIPVPEIRLADNPECRLAPDLGTTIKDPNLKKDRTLMSTFGKIPIFMNATMLNAMAVIIKRKLNVLTQNQKTKTVFIPAEHENRKFGTNKK